MPRGCSAHAVVRSVQNLDQRPVERGSSFREPVWTVFLLNMLPRVDIARLKRGVKRLVVGPTRIGRHVRAREAMRRFRGRLLLTPPIDTPDSGDAEVHVLAGRRSLLDLIASLKSFYRFLNDPIPI